MSPDTQSRHCEMCGDIANYRRTGWYLTSNGTPVPQHIWLCGECLKEDLVLTVSKSNDR